MTGRFTDHHAFLLATDAAPDRRASTPTSPAWRPRSRQGWPLSRWRWPGSMRSPVSAWSPRPVIIAEIGVDMSRFPTPAHLAPGRSSRPGVKESAGRRKGNAATGHGNRYLARVLGEAAVVAGQNRHLPRRTLPAHRPTARQEEAIVAVGRSILVIIWHLLSDPEARFQRPGRRLLRHPPGRTAESATTSANSKRSATGSPSNPPPDPTDQHEPGSAALRRVLRLPTHHSFSD